MKKLILLPLILLLIFPSLSYGQSNNGSLSASKTGTAIGGAVGGVIGRQIGNGTGKTLSAFLGVLSGGYLGNILGGFFNNTSSGSGASGASGGGMLTFGGKITAVWPCTCSEGLTAVLVGPPKGGIFILSLTSKLYNNMKPIPGSWIIGDYSPGGVCLQVGTPCYPYPPTQGTITRIGTS